MRLGRAYSELPRKGWLLCAINVTEQSAIRIPLRVRLKAEPRLDVVC